MKYFSNKFLLILGIVISLTIACNRQLNLSTSIEVTQTNKVVTVAVISDLNSQYGSTEYEPEITKAIDLIINRWQPDLVLGGGDAIAGQKASLTEARIKAMWQAFDLNVAQPLRENQIPYAFTIGNHDGSGAIKNERFVFANERELASQYWNNSEHNPGLKFSDRANFPFYYSFLQNDIYYLVWDASTNKIDSEQLAWIEQNLSGEPAQQATMRIAIGHLPLYAVAQEKNKPGEYLAEAEKLRSLLEKYRVHTYISGHHHAYYPGKKGLLELLHAGALGQGARQLMGSNLPPKNTITLIAIDLNTKTTIYNTYDIKTMEKIDRRGLPESIQSNNGTIFRRDITKQVTSNFLHEVE